MSELSIQWGFIAAGVMLAAGIWVVLAKQKGGWGPRNIQAFGLVLLIPAIIVLAVLKIIDGAVVATLLGSVAGYVLGNKFSQEKEE